MATAVSESLVLCTSDPSRGNVGTFPCSLVPVLGRFPW